MSDLFRLDGKTVLITGASRGIGKAVAAACAAQGAKLLITAKNPDALARTRQELSHLGAVCHHFCADLENLQDVQGLIDWAQGYPVDCCINNAAFTSFVYPTETRPEVMESLFHTNFRASVLLAQAMAKHMLARKCRGSILFITSINAISPLPSQAIYSSTKAALESVMKSFASELAPKGIRVNSIAPGAIMTDMNPTFTPEKRKEFNPEIPLGRIGEPEDIGGAAAFLCSDAAQYITGSTLVIDGGYLLRR